MTHTKLLIILLLVATSELCASERYYATLAGLQGRVEIASPVSWDRESTLIPGPFNRWNSTVLTVPYWIPVHQIIRIDRVETTP